MRPTNVTSADRQGSVHLAALWLGDTLFTATLLTATLLTAIIASSAAAQMPVEGESLLGTPLLRPVLPADFVIEQTRRLEQARLRLIAAPDDVEAKIWMGRRLAYLGRYRQAIDAYTQALADHPRDPRLFRHRGHRYLTLRRLDEAISDFEEGLALTRGGPDSIEPDGLPNVAGIPTSTLQSNLWYHLGLAHYVAGDLERALVAYRSCLEVSKNPDGAVSASYWLYMTLARLGQGAEARRLLESIEPSLELIENHDYHRLLLLFRGMMSADELAGPLAGETKPSTLSSATVAYGVGRWYALQGREQRALEAWREVLKSDQWPSFGYLAAESALAQANQEPAEPGAGATPGNVATPHHVATPENVAP